MVESCGWGDYEEFHQALPHIDAMFLDIKHIDSGLHKSMTGVGNELILENIQRISQFGIPITVRTPIVPGYTDTPDNITGISQFIARLPTVKGYELLEYHNLGESKYAALGIPYKLKGVPSPSDQEMKDLIQCANQVLLGYQKECYRIKENKKEVIV